MAPVQLPDRQQVHGRGEHAHPSPSRHRVETQIGRSPRRENRASQQPFQARHAKLHAALMADTRNRFGQGNPHRQRRQQEREPRQRSGNSDIEQHPLGINRRAHADKSPERAQHRRRHEIRQAGVNPVIDCRQVVAKLVRQQNRQQGERKRQAAHQCGRMVPEPRIQSEAAFQIERHVALEIELHRRAHQRGGKQRHREQQPVKPVAFTGRIDPHRRRHRERIGIAARCGKRKRRRRRILGGHRWLTRRRLTAASAVPCRA